MGTELQHSTNGHSGNFTPPDAKPVLCAVCKSNENVEFLTITDCNLCGKCQDELADGFQQVMTMDRSEYPEL
jgi:hypothetical protein